MAKPKNHKIFLILVPIFIFAATGAFFLVKFLLQHSPLTPPTGTISYDTSLPSAQLAFLEDLLADVQPVTDFTISAATSTTRPTSSDTLVYDILVPVTDFYNPANSISATDPNLHLISINQLKSTQKLLALDQDYFFDNFSSGAEFHYFIINANSSSSAPENSEQSTTHDSERPATGNSNQPATTTQLIALIQPHLPTFPTAETTLSLTQTGVTALSRGMGTMLQQKSGDATYFAAQIAPFLQAADLTHISNEVSFVDNCQISSGTTTLCAPPAMLDAITTIGTDIIELTGNHNNDYGDGANLSTIATYHSLGLQTFGGGANETLAATPLQIDQKSAKITLLGYNYSTSTKANGQGATDDHPGANIYNETHAANDIATAKTNGDFVIVDVQYFECYAYPDYGAEIPSCDAPISGQQDFFRHLIDLGADMVVGTSAHQPQTYELYHDKPIYYGLGNLFFDQIYWPGTTRSLILTHYFVNGQYRQTRLSPTVYDQTLQTRLMNDTEASQFLSRLANSRPEPAN